MSDCTHYSKGAPPDGRPCGWCAVEKAKEKEDEIERLREKIASMERGVRGAVLGEKYKLVERIEELEKEREECVNQCPAPTIAQAAAMTHGERLHLLTDEQIDAAWGLTDVTHPFYDTYCLPYEAVEYALEKLGYEKCGGCDGSGGICISTENGEMDGDCGCCDGYGWVKKAEAPLWEDGGPRK